MGKDIGKEPANPGASRPESGAPIAPWWHTGALVALIVLVAVVGTALAHREGSARAVAPSSRLVGAYLPLWLVNVTLLVYVCRVGRERSALRALLGALPANLARLLGDAALAAAGVAFLGASELAWQRLVGVSQSDVVRAFLPHTLTERVAWALVATTVGCCEEVVYRGYLQTQLAAFTRRAWLGVVLQALLFGVAHLDQGATTALRVAVYGAGFGVLAHCRRSLVPGILAHVALDILVGLGR